MQSKLKFLVSVVIMSLGLGACYYDVESELYPSQVQCDNSVFSYNGRIKAICDANCATSSCHAGPSPSASLALETFEQVRDATANGLLCTIEQTSGCSPMPKNEPKMSQCSIDAWILWHDSSFPEN